MRRVVMILIAQGMILALLPFAAPHDPLRTEPASAFSPPSRVHPLGTDQFGRDIASRLLHGGWRTYTTAVIASALAIGIGICLGGLGAWGGRWIGMLSRASIDGLLAFPALLLALGLVVITGRGQAGVVTAVGIALAGVFARYTDGALTSLRSADYLTSARALGATEIDVLRRHVLPAAADALLAYAAIIFNYALVTTTALAFFGLTGDPSIPDWGVMLYEGRQVFRASPYSLIGAGVGIAIVVAVTQVAISQRK